MCSLKIVYFLMVSFMTELNSIYINIMTPQHVNVLSYFWLHSICIFISASFSIKSGGTELTSSSGIEFDGESETLEAASFYTSSDYKWAVSNTGNFISNPNGPLYIAKTDSQIIGTLESELYKTARISPSSLRYYGLGLKNGKYSVDLHFAEIAMEDLQSWKGLGRRLFDVYIQVC